MVDGARKTQDDPCGTGTPSSVAAISETEDYDALVAMFIRNGLEFSA